MKARPKISLVTRKRRYFQREDLFAIPLCLLWGIGFFGWAVGTFSTLAGVAKPGASSGIAQATLAAMVSLPLTLAKHLITLVS
jgi:hypothetical protein